MKTTKTLGLLLALGMGAFISNASAQNAPVQLPKPGEYKGTLTISRTLEDRPLAEGPTIIMKKVVKATARVDAAGYIRIAYAEDLEPVIGKFDASTPTTLHAHGVGYLVAFDARTIVLKTSGVTDMLPTSDGQLVPCFRLVTTKLKWVRK